MERKKEENIYGCVLNDYDVWRKSDENKKGEKKIF